MRKLINIFENRVYFPKMEVALKKLANSLHYCEIEHRKKRLEFIVKTIVEDNTYRQVGDFLSFIFTCNLAYHICKDNCLDLIDKLIERRNYSRELILEILFSSCRCGNLEVLKYLISKEVDLHSLDCYALKLAKRHGRKEIIKVLMENMK